MRVLLHWLMAILFVAEITACRSVESHAYVPREGDIVFQSLPHAPLVDAIEGVTGSSYSHCGIIVKVGSEWRVLEAIGPVRETPLSAWIAQGRGHAFASYRLDDSLSARIPQIIAEGRKFLGRPYDIHYRFDDDAIYCSELVYKAVMAATGRSLGHVQRIAELNWKPHARFIESIEGTVPLERELISPRALSEAPELRQVYVTGKPSA